MKPALPRVEWTTESEKRNIRDWVEAFDVSPEQRDDIFATMVAQVNHERAVTAEEIKHLYASARSFWDFYYNQIDWYEGASPQHIAMTIENADQLDELCVDLYKALSLFAPEAKVEGV